MICTYNINTSNMLKQHINQLHSPAHERIFPFGQQLKSGIRQHVICLTALQLNRIFLSICLGK